MVDDIGEHFGKPVVKTLPLTPRGPSPLAGISEAGEQAAQRDEVDAAMSRHAAIAVVHFARDEFVGALETESFPECPPGPVATLASRLVWSASMRAKMTFDSRRFRTRRAIIDGMPPALCRS